MLNRLGPTPMQIEVWSAVHAGDVELVKKLVASGANVNQRRRETSTLHAAARNGFTDLVKILLAEGADHSLKDRWEKTPLHHAATEGHAAVTRSLLQANANINALDRNRKTPLLVALEPVDNEEGEKVEKTVCLGVIAALVAAGADPTYRYTIPRMQLPGAKRRQSSSDQRPTPLVHATEHSRSAVILATMERAKTVVQFWTFELHAEAPVAARRWVATVMLCGKRVASRKAGRLTRSRRYVRPQLPRLPLEVWAITFKMLRIEDMLG
eukprot:m.403323 g.403323  ORF g.403323 m.403323 type:complete len:268 (+) comp16789_c1_seq5:13-816(+)